MAAVWQSFYAPSVTTAIGMRFAAHLTAMASTITE